jgi:hypothetical protein
MVRVRRGGRVDESMRQRAFLILALAAGSMEGVAEACSVSSCDPAMAFPTPGVSGAALLVPANLPAFGLSADSRFTSRMPTPAEVTLRRVDGASAMAVAFTLEDARSTAGLWAIRPSAPLVAGASYELSVPSLCDDREPGSGPPAPRRVRVTPAVPEPTTLGRISLDALSEGDAVVPPWTWSASCADSARIAQRPVRLQMDAAAEPWREVLSIQLFVDGAPRGAARVGGYPVGEPFLSRSGIFGVSSQLPYVVCRGTPAAAAYGLTPGRHRFEFRGRILGSSVEVRSDVAEAEFHCGVGVTEDAGAATSAVTDAAAGAVTDAAAGADLGPPPSPDGDGGGGANCSARPATGPAGSRLAVGAVLGVAVAAGRRRRRRAAGDGRRS